MNKEKLLQIENIRIGFSSVSDYIIKNISFDIKSGEIHAVIGASGSGKSLLAHAVMDILPNNAVIHGNILYKNTLLTKNNINSFRGSKIAFIPQSVTYLDPLMKIEKHLKDSAFTEKSMTEFLEKYKLDKSVLKKYPHELSGGMIRKILFAIGINAGADLIIADEPTPGLDLESAVKVMEDFKNITKEGKGVLLITHDIDLALKVADRISICYNGELVETAVKDDFTGSGKLRHPYTINLYSSLPQNKFTYYAGSNVKISTCCYSGECFKENDNCKNHIAFRHLRNGYVRCNNAS